MNKRNRLDHQKQKNKPTELEKELQAWQERLERILARQTMYVRRANHAN
ncbi:hypothetical protein GYA49_01215 [Candidatus Beckwithbacteria bacterium]|nr:hypothetical protein [Candidatus Beckwithbacteria bacterium]